MHVLIIGSGGIGRASAEQAIEQQKKVTIITRQAADQMPAGAQTLQVPDWQWESVSAALDTLSPLPDRVIVATGLLWNEDMQPEKRTEDLQASALTASLQANTFVPAAVLSHLARRLKRQNTMKVLVVTAKVGSISDNRLGGWYAYRASKAATHMLIKTTAIEWQRRFPQVALAAYHPGTTDSGLSQPFQGRVPSQQLKTPVETAQCLWRVLENQVDADHSGQFWNWDGAELPW